MACAGAPRPDTQLASSEGAIRGAQEAGADKIPNATLHLKLAEEQRAIALTMVKNGDNHRAAMMLERAEADAELAVALARAQRRRRSPRRTHRRPSTLSRPRGRSESLQALCNSSARDVLRMRACAAAAGARPRPRRVPARTGRPGLAHRPRQKLHVAFEALDVAERAYKDDREVARYRRRVVHRGAEGRARRCTPGSRRRRRSRSKPPIRT